MQFVISIISMDGTMLSIDTGCDININLES